MTRMRPGLRLVFVAVGLWTALASSGWAEARTADDELAPLIFRLTIYGDVPRGDSFEIVFKDNGDDVEADYLYPPSSEAYRCYSHPDADCTDGVAVYVHSSIWGIGQPLHFRFFRDPAGKAPRSFFYEGTRIVNGRTVIDAYYKYPSGQVQMPTKLPSAGAGGMEGYSGR